MCAGQTGQTGGCVRPDLQLVHPLGLLSLGPLALGDPGHNLLQLGLQLLPLVLRLGLGLLEALHLPHQLLVGALLALLVLFQVSLELDATQSRAAIQR